VLVVYSICGCGPGFDDKIIKEVYTELKNLKEINKPIKEKVLDDKNRQFGLNSVVCENQYSSISKDGEYILKQYF